MCLIAHTRFIQTHNINLPPSWIGVRFSRTTAEHCPHLGEQLMMTTTSDGALWGKRVLTCVLITLALQMTAVTAHSQTTPQAAPIKVTGDLTQMSIEDLMNLEVTSGAKKEESLQRTAAAIFVITSEDIRRSGATNLPDVLRMAPGLDVAQVNGNVWAVSSRGFNNAFANKMLVLVDGRTVYSPAFSGVFWDAQDILLANVERIEVISGPGAALWGTNAVNGVINIITKDSAKTQGGMVTGAGGNVVGGYGAGQYGGQLPGGGTYRIFAKGFSTESEPGNPGQGPQDGWNLEHGGFRADWILNSRDSLTVEGDLFRTFGQGTTTFTTSLTPLIFAPLPGGLEDHGGNILARWKRAITPSSEISLQVYYDRESGDAGFVAGTSNTVDVEFQHHFSAGKRHDIVWGVDYREIQINTSGGISVAFTPPRSIEHLGSGFFQDQIELVPGRLRLTLGGRVQREYTTQFDFQPDARLLWTPAKRQAVWLAASRALRGDSPSDTTVRALLSPVPGPSGLLIVPEAFGNPMIRPEAEIAFQAGYRVQISSSISVSASAYLNHYTRLKGESAGAPILEGGTGIPFLLLPEIENNRIDGETHGIEFFGNWKPVSIWKLSGGFTWLDGEFRDGSTNPPPNTTATTLNSPHHQFSIRSTLDLPHRFEFDSALYRVGPVDAMAVPGYYRLDARIGWRVGEHAEFSVVGQNLLSSSHFEAGAQPDWFSAVAVRRSYYGKVMWRFQGISKK
jgi:iron complex outermembrane receptor protein